MGMPAWLRELGTAGFEILTV